MSAGRRTFVVISVAILAIFFAIFLVWPMLYVVKGAFYYNNHVTFEFFSANLSGLSSGLPSFWAHPLDWMAGALHNMAEYPIFVSLALGVVVTLAATAIAMPLALVSVRRDFCGRGWMSALVMLPLILPPFVGAIGMKQMFALDGSVNIVLERVFYGITWGLSHVGLMSAPWTMPHVGWLKDAGFWSVVVLTTLHLYPIMFLNVAASLAAVDRSAEEAAANLGAPRWNVFRRITFPMMLPGYFAGASIVFIWAFTDLGTPLILNYQNVVPVQIFRMADQAQENPMGYALVVMVLTVSLLAFLGARGVLSLKPQAASTKGTASESLRRASRGGTALIWLFLGGLTFAAVIPHIAVILSSFTAPGGWNDTVLPAKFTLSEYHTLVTHPTALSGLLNSLLYSVLATIAAVVFGVLIAYLLTREKFLGQGALDGAVMAPLALPGIVLAYGYLACFVGGPLNPLQNPVPLLVISYVVRRLPYMVRAAVAGFQHVAGALEDASRNLGASALTTLRRITLPLVFANLVAGAVLTFVFSMFEVSQSLILAQDASYFPIARVLYKLFDRLEDGPYVASAMGVLGMIVLAAGLLISGRFLGKRMGEIFRA